jgi:hypothetical protein
MAQRPATPEGGKSRAETNPGSKKKGKGPSKSQKRRDRDRRAAEQRSSTDRGQTSPPATDQGSEVGGVPTEASTTEQPQAQRLQVMPSTPPAGPRAASQETEQEVEGGEGAAPEPVGLVASMLTLSGGLITLTSLVGAGAGVSWCWANPQFGLHGWAAALGAAISVRGLVWVDHTFGDSPPSSHLAAAHWGAWVAASFAAAAQFSVASGQEFDQFMVLLAGVAALWVASPRRPFGARLGTWATEGLSEKGRTLVSGTLVRRLAPLAAAVAAVAVMGGGATAGALHEKQEEPPTEEVEELEQPAEEGEDRQDAESTDQHASALGSDALHNVPPPVCGPAWPVQPSMEELASTTLGESSSAVGAPISDASDATLQEWTDGAGGRQWLLLGPDGEAGVITQGLRSMIEGGAGYWPVDPSEIRRILGGWPMTLCRLAPGGELVPLSDSGTLTGMAFRPNQSSGVPMRLTPADLLVRWLSESERVGCLLVTVTDVDASGQQEVSGGAALSAEPTEPLIVINDLHEAALSLRVGSSISAGCG